MDDSPSVDPEASLSADCSLVGRLITDRPIYKSGIRSSIFRSWHFIRQLEVEELDATRFIFGFPSIKFRDRIIQQSPWNIKGYLLVLKIWEVGDTIDEVDFSHSLFWFQIHGLPLGFSTKKEAELAVSRLGLILEIDFRSKRRV